MHPALHHALPPALPNPSALASHWMLDSSVVMLNHGSFGATPRVILARQEQLRQQMEAEPVGFFVEALEPLLDTARSALAAFLACDSDDLAFVPNASAGVSTILRSLRFEPGDEILAFHHEYNACKNALLHIARQNGARVVIVRFPFPAGSSEQIAHAITSAITPRTRLLLLSHITSPSATLCPAAEIIRLAQTQGVDVLLDSAHGPGNIPLDLKALGAAYTTGNLHKWCCAGKGTAFLHVRRDRQHLISPLIISHGANSKRTDRSRFRLEADFTGTQDLSGPLSLPEVLQFLPSLLPAASWQAVMAHNHALAQQGAGILAAALGTSPALPRHLATSMALVPLPRHDDAVEARLKAMPTRYEDALQDRLLQRHRVQVPILRMPQFESETAFPDTGPTRHARISAQLYNSPSQYSYLAEALKVELAAECE